MAMAIQHSATLRTFVDMSLSAGAARDRLILIPSAITKDERVAECIVFYMFTGVLVDVHTLTKGGTVSVYDALTHQSVYTPDFEFDLMVSVCCDCAW